MVYSHSEVLKMESEKRFFQKDWGEAPCCSECEIEHCMIPCDKYNALVDEQVKIIKELEDKMGFGKEEKPTIGCEHNNRLIYNLIGEYGAKEKVLMCRRCWLKIIRVSHYSVPYKGLWVNKK